MDFPKQDRGAWIRDLVLPGALGFAIFVAFCGVRILDPTNLNWIFATPGDPTQHQIGWSFFRNTPFWQFPLGLNPGYGEAISSSIVFSDSIPLFALFFKLWRDVLPADFQYMGLWVATCLVLQAVFAWKILAAHTGDTRLRLLGCALFCLSPVMLFRLIGHEALIGHWLLLAALWLYLRERRSVAGWFVLVAAAVMVHGYLLAMVGAIWAASLVQQGLARRSLLRLALEAVAMLVFVFAVAKSIGYFVVGGETGDGFGYFRMNLLALFYPDEYWSIFRVTLAHGGEYEGFAYPGAGIFLLGVGAIVLAARGRGRGVRMMNWRKTAPLVALCVLFFVFALSNRVALGAHELFQYPLPSRIEHLCTMFRSSGRFIWPVIYAGEIFLLVFVLRACPRRVAIGLLSACVLLQAADLTRASIHYRKLWAHEWHNPLVSAFWKAVPGQYQRIAFVMMLDGQDTYGPIAYFAAQHGMTVNGGSLARVDTNAMREMQRDLTERMESGRYRSDTLYIFNQEGNWNTARQHYRGNGLVGVVDTYRVIAPGWKGCTTDCGVRRDAVADKRD